MASVLAPVLDVFNGRPLSTSYQLHANTLSVCEASRVHGSEGALLASESLRLCVCEQKVWADRREGKFGLILGGGGVFFAVFLGT